MASVIVDVSFSKVMSEFGLHNDEAKERGKRRNRKLLQCKS
jgi:hypothetical protein